MTALEDTTAAFVVSGTDSSIDDNGNFFTINPPGDQMFPADAFDDGSAHSLNGVNVFSNGNISISISGTNSTFTPAVESGIRVTLTAGSDALSFTGFGSGTSEPYTVAPTGGVAFYNALTDGESVTLRFQYP